METVRRKQWNNRVIVRRQSGQRLRWEMAPSPAKGMNR
jgi:hypothetical protein